MGIWRSTTGREEILNYELKTGSHVSEPSSVGKTLEPSCCYNYYGSKLIRIEKTQPKSRFTHSYCLSSQTDQQPPLLQPEDWTVVTTWTSSTASAVGLNSSWSIGGV